MQEDALRARVRAYFEKRLKRIQELFAQRHDPPQQRTFLALVRMQEEMEKRTYSPEEFTKVLKGLEERGEKRLIAEIELHQRAISDLERNEYTLARDLLRIELFVGKRSLEELEESPALILTVGKAYYEDRRNEFQEVKELFRLIETKTSGLKISRLN